MKKRCHVSSSGFGPMLKAGPKVEFAKLFHIAIIMIFEGGTYPQHHQLEVGSTHHSPSGDCSGGAQCVKQP